MKNAFRKFKNIGFALVLLALVTTKVSAHEKTYVGASQSMGNGTIRSWVKINHGNLVAIGVTFDENALKGLPAELPAGQENVEYTLALPPEAADTVFNHVGVNWNPHGHEPSKIYDVGHFDFHFYLISPAERARITAKGDDLAKVNRPLLADYMPPVTSSRTIR